MGGLIGWTIRLEDGAEHRMTQWTNIFPDASMNEAFLSGDKAAIDETLGIYPVTRRDWEANHQTGNFEHPMTKYHGPYQRLVPSEYGIIVTDFVTKKIVSCQGYCDLLSFLLTNDPRKREPGQVDTEGRNLSYLYGDLQRMFNERRLNIAHRGDESININDFNSIDDVLDALFSRADIRLEVAPPHPWRVIRFNENTGRRAAYDEIKSMGFALSAHEEIEFERWIEGLSW